MDALLILELGAWISTGICALGVVLCAFILGCLVHSRINIDRSDTPGNISFALVLMLSTCALFGIEFSVINILWLVGSQALHDALSSSLGYLFLVLLMTSNCLLALERYYLITIGSPVSTTVVVSLFALCIPFLACICVSLVLSTWKAGFLAYQLAPFVMPGSDANGFAPAIFPVWMNPEAILFVVGVSFFPVSILCTIAVYARSYGVARKSVVGEWRDAKIDEEGGDNDHSSDVGDDHEQQQQQQQQHGDSQPGGFGAGDSTSGGDDQKATCHQRAKERELATQLSILYRCVCMSAGLILFYIPPLVCVFARMAGVAGLRADDENIARQAWLYTAMSILSSCDTVWTPVMVLVLMGNYRRIVWRTVKGIIRK
ncbi:hypothetical protein BDR26DRAFT_868651 [Obelidium mucronatum]|nr:hypothetical protein BDR26DRAFT_868651 [Obelidium mucronatum]